MAQNITVIEDRRLALTCYVGRLDLRRLQRHATRLSISQAEVTRRAIRAYLDVHEPESAR